MKKNLKLIIVVIISLFIFENVSAGSLSLSSNTTATVGNRVIVTVKSDNVYAKYSLKSENPSVLQLISGESTISSDIDTGDTTTYTFVAKNPGTTKIKLVLLDCASYDSGGCENKEVSIRVYAPRSLSTNNNLSSITIDGATLSPEFNHDTLEYNVSLEPGTEKINVNATVADKYASVSGTGEKEVVEGDNLIELVVTAESGGTKTYKINATVKEYNPIKVKVDGKEYTVVRNKKNLEPPANYEETSLKIGEEEVPAYQSEITKYLLVSLKDPNGKQDWYIKEKDNYKLYKEYKFSNTVLYPLVLEKIPTGYSKTSIKYNDEKIVSYKLKNSSKYALIYAMNVETGKENIYMYDSKEDTVQIYNDEHVNNLMEENDLYLKIIIGLSAGIVLCLGIIIFILIKKKKSIKE